MVTEPVIDVGSDMVTDNFQTWVVPLVKKPEGTVQFAQSYNKFQNSWEVA